MHVASRWWVRCAVGAFLAVGLIVGSTFAQTAGAGGQNGQSGQRPGRSDPAFSQPSIAPGTDYTVPSEAEIKAVLDRIRDHLVRSTPYRVIDTATGQPITDFAKPTKTAGIDNRAGEFNDWTYSMGVVLAAMLQVTDVTGDASFQDYTIKNFNFIFEHLPYFRQQAKEFGPQSYGYRRLLEMRELDDCGAIGAALIKTMAKKPDPRYKEGIDLAANHILTKQLRLPDGTLARPRPVPVALWIDDAYMSIPFLAQMGKTTGDTKYFDDAARQVIGMSARLFDASKGLYDHSWFANMDDDARFYWGRGDGWMVMAMAELLSVMPELHPDRAKVLEIFRRAARGAVETQGGTGLWHQLLDKTDSYLETSASAMFTFGIARGVNRGWLPTSYAPVAQSGWRALEQRVRPDGQIEGICVGTTAAYDAVYYYNRPTALNAMQGYGPTLMAGAEVLTMIRSFEIRRVNNTFYYFAKQK
ncbi:MAG: glycoside hydrolase family 88 protein [Acidobacteria bacterium]|nr:glycoside hydrolase family 88 protein [Acidobacteriota bacterium]